MISLGIDNLQFTLDLLSAEICLLPLLPHIILFLYENSVHSKRHLKIFLIIRLCTCYIRNY